MGSEKQVVVINSCTQCWPCVVCRQFAEVGEACNAGRTADQCSKEIASSDGRLSLLMIKDPFVEEGAQDYDEGCDINECPYEEGTDGQTGWRIGWREAKEREEQGAYKKL